MRERGNRKITSQRRLDERGGERRIVAKNTLRDAPRREPGERTRLVGECFSARPLAMRLPLSCDDPGGFAKREERVPWPLRRVRRAYLVDGAPVGRAPRLRPMPGGEPFLGTVSARFGHSLHLDRKHLPLVAAATHGELVVTGER